MSDLAKRIGKKIVKLRNSQKMTQEKLAYENDISKGYLSELESGKKLPSLLMLEKIAEALGVDIKDMF